MGGRFRVVFWWFGFGLVGGFFPWRCGHRLCVCVDACACVCVCACACPCPPRKATHGVLEEDKLRARCEIRAMLSLA